MAFDFPKRTAAALLAGGLFLTGSLQAGLWPFPRQKWPDRPRLPPPTGPCHGFHQTSWKPWDCWYGDGSAPGDSDPSFGATPGVPVPDASVPFGHTPVPEAAPIPLPAPQSAPRDNVPRTQPPPPPKTPQSAVPYDATIVPTAAIESSRFRESSIRRADVRESVPTAGSIVDAAAPSDDATWKPSATGYVPADAASAGPGRHMTRSEVRLLGRPIRWPSLGRSPSK